MSKKISIGVFVTSHGLGHGTRVCAILNEVISKISCELVIISLLPEWFFTQNLLRKSKFVYKKYKTDVGLVQSGPFHHSLTKTNIELNKFLCFEQNSSFKKVLTSVKNCKAIISDISPLGIYIGGHLEIPTILIENFTWDWIYKNYSKELPNFRNHIRKLTNIYKSVDLHIQTTPYCNPIPKAIKVPPVFRKHKKNSKILRKSLLKNPEDKLILVTTGGISKSYGFTKDLLSQKSCIFILSSSEAKLVKKGNIIYLPMNSRFHYPDIVGACDVVVGKVGYGTIAECWASNTPILGCFRNDFRESEKLMEFARKNLHTEIITLNEFENASWLTKAMNIHSRKEYGQISGRKNGSKFAAKEIINFIGQI